MADVLLVLGWTGMRWGEARSVLVEDVVDVPTPGLLVRRSQTEGGAAKATKGRRGRRVPVADRILPIIERVAEEKEPTDLLITTGGGAQLHRTAVLRTVKWDQTAKRPPHPRPAPHGRVPVAGTRRGPRHRPGMDGARVNRHNEPLLHFLGASADQAGLDRLNDPAAAPL